MDIIKQKKKIKKKIYLYLGEDTDVPFEVHQIAINGGLHVAKQRARRRSKSLGYFSQNGMRVGIVHNLSRQCAPHLSSKIVPHLKDAWSAHDKAHYSKMLQHQPNQ
jgi:hypothetical protein